MRILVTGGAGFIGSHIVRLLMTEGHAVTVLDNFSTGDRSHLPEAGFDLWAMDVRTEEARIKMLSVPFDGIVHLAAQTMVDSSIRNPLFDAQQNIVGSVNVLEAAKRTGARVIFASTAAAYGDVAETELPVQEGHVLVPMSFYGLTKVTVERYLKLYHQLYGLDYVVLRFANVYGERQGDKGEGGVISIFCKRVAQGLPITIFGDGEQTRDFVYAGDIARGIYAALQTPSVNTVYNLSTMTETSLNTLVEALGQAAGHNIYPSYAEARTGDIYRSMLDNHAAREHLGWQPKMTIVEGIGQTYQYFHSLYH
ncbi:MAG: NAD-dependent epimerase/dehydratase family protein [Selenomonadaceae bacterium]|nr:NAD-dependent epimerase/dehydratase family protein [Selenomonadaceae bacterium]MDY3915651.1 NAD-dependent epimerase/dehydratase family protein [Selenomonadaceae bacterium]